MAYPRLNTNDLIKKMSNAKSVVSNWDVLCSYDLLSLNKVLLEEYKKRPVNTRWKFVTTKIVMDFDWTISCDIHLGSPSLQFSTAQSGTYDLLMPMEAGSHCNQTMGNQTKITNFPSGYKVLTSGPLKTVKGNGRNQTVYSSNEIIEFGDQTEATVILHFCKNSIRAVRIDPQIYDKKLQALFDVVTNHFKQNITEVNYHIATIRKDPPKKGLVLTPKSFMFTTTADERNKENGALNIWVQTHESGRSKGNADPSFYPNSNVLPVPLGHSSSIVFSHQLIYHNYLKPALDKHYRVTFTDLITSNGVHVDALNLVLINKTSQYFFRRFPGIESFTYAFNIDFNNSPFQIYTHNDYLHLVWKYENILEYDATKVLESMGVGAAGGAASGALIGVFFGPIGAFVGATVGGFAGAGVGGGMSAVNRVKQQFTVTLSVDKPIPFVSTDNTKFSAELKLSPHDLRVKAQLNGETGYSIFNKLGLSVEEVQSDIISQLQEVLILPDIDLGTLDYFAEANILFNEGRFKISTDKAIHFPYDTIIIGDIDMPQTSKNRYKREENNPFIYPETIGSSASRITTPINSMINWLTDSFKQISLLNPFDGINKIFALPQTTEKIASNVAHFDVNSSLLLGDLFIRSFTKEKPFYVVENQTDYAEIKAHALNILTEYENMLEEKGLLSAFPDFDPLLLMSTLEKEIINGDLEGTFDILNRPILDNVAFEELADIEKKIYDILQNQETPHTTLFQKI